MGLLVPLLWISGDVSAGFQCQNWFYLLLQMLPDLSYSGDTIAIESGGSDSSFPTADSARRRNTQFKDIDD